MLGRMIFRSIRKSARPKRNRRRRPVRRTRTTYTIRISINLK